MLSLFGNSRFQGRYKSDLKQLKSINDHICYIPSDDTVGLLVHVENRNGNTPARYRQDKTLESCFDNLDAHQIKIAHFRADSASYKQMVLELVAQRVTYFYIRNINSDGFLAIVE